MATESTPPPSVAPPWIRQWDASSNVWLFTNTSTDERTYDYDHDLINTSSQGKEGTDYAAQYPSNVPQRLSSAIQSVETAPESLAYGVGEAVEPAGAYQEGIEGAVEGVKDSMAGWIADAAAAVGRDMEQGLSDIAEAPGAAVRAVGEGVENAEQLGEDVGDAVADAPEKVVEGVREGMGEVQRFGEDVGGAVADVPEEAMGRIGEGVEDVREVGEGVGRYGDSLGLAYDQGREEGRSD